MDNWFQIATSSKAEVPADDEAVHVYQAGLGDLTIGLPTAESAANNHNKNTAAAAMSDPALASNNYFMVDPFKSQKTTEEIYKKSNLEYEHRLKEHLY